MTAREFQPGEVALIEVGSSARAHVAIRDSSAGWLIGDSHAWRFLLDRQDPEVTVVRPLVVIDPEDREQVERLTAALIGAPDPFVARIDDVQAALREYANPTPPKPPEPTGLGAVVEDAEGKRWVRNNPRGVAAWSPENAGADGLAGPYRHYDRVAAVRILSHGVTEGGEDA